MSRQLEENRESRAESGAGCAAELRRSEREFLRRNLVAKNNFLEFLKIESVRIRTRALYLRVSELFQLFQSNGLMTSLSKRNFKVCQDHLLFYVEMAFMVGSVISMRLYYMY